ncbi:probable nicotianamine synthase 4 [Euphorbia lathyris]|uniref:probable nicotianamine synthase 4 n=1 Tax=Euphorbia lathyris TaxID=212925 RepID=UPI00331342BD
MGCQEEVLVQKICNFYEQISSLKTLKPSKDVDTLFTNLVLTCIPTITIDVNNLSTEVQEMRSKLIKLCGEAEGYMEAYFSNILSSFQNPLNHLNLFPYYSNYLKLSHLEFTILTNHFPDYVPKKIAFVGSGPLPLTSIVLASNHLTSTTFHNFDVDPVANSMAIRLVSPDPDLSKRMLFRTTNVLDVGDELKEFDVVFLAALVGIDKEGKVKVIDHLAKFMAPGGVLMVRSAHGARSFIYPVVDTCDLKGFEVLSVFHPTDEVINSVIIARKLHSIDQQCANNLILPSKCSEIQGFNQLMVEEFITIEDQLS